MNQKRKNIELAVLLGLICAIVLNLVGFESACEDIRSNVLRLHIIANSDGKTDQSVKLAVRDAILNNSGIIFDECVDLAEAKRNAAQKIGIIKETADSVLVKNGIDYRAEVSVEKCFFETREYEDFTLPAGEYDSVVVRLGKAEGKNFWCVVFPAVCIPAADASLSQTVGDKGVEIAENPQRYVMKFKIVEWYESIKKR